MSRRIWSPAAVALALGLLIGAAAPAGAADEPPDPKTFAALDGLTARIERAILRAEKRMDADWEPIVALAVDAGSLDRLERSLATIRVDATEMLQPIIGPTSTGAVPAAITALYFEEDMGYLQRRDLEEALGPWKRFDARVDRAMELRDQLRHRLGRPSVTGLRVCPLEEVDTLIHDWGDPRGWRSHRGNDVNAPEGTRLVAMERGEVIQMGWHWLGGNGIYVRGAVTGDVYYYAHMSAYAEGIEVGTPVLAGQVVGYVGNTGNSDVPHLHLGWMPRAGQVDLDGLEDAYPMLVELCL